MLEYERSLVKKLEGFPVELVGVNNDKDAAATHERCLKENISWRSFHVAGWEDGRLDRLNINGIPQFYLIDQNGIVQQETTGGILEIKSKLIPQIESLLSEMGHDVSLLDDKERAEVQTEKRRSRVRRLALSQIKDRLIQRQSLADDYLVSLLPDDDDDLPQGITEELKRFLIKPAVLLEHDDAVLLVEELVANSNNSYELNDIAWLIVQVNAAIGLNQPLLEQASYAIEKALSISPDDPGYIDTAAHLARDFERDIDKAIGLQKRALQLANDKELPESTIEQLQATLKEFEADRDRQ